MTSTDPRVLLEEVNHELEHTEVESKEEAAAYRSMLLVRAVLMVACELRELRATCDEFVDMKT